MTASARARWHLPLLVALGIPVFFLGLGSYSVVSGDEGYYHTAALHMVESGDWFTLEFHGEPRTYDTFMNAPTQYWARALLILALGDNLWSMRLLSAVFGLLTVLATYRLARAIAPDRGPAAALVAGLVQLTCYQSVWLHGARTGELDAIVSFLLAAAVLSLVRAVRDGRSFVPHHLCLAFLVTVKLPLVLVPVLAELVLVATTPAVRAHLRRYLRSAVLVVPLGLVWHAAQAVRLRDDFAGVAAQMLGQASGAVGWEDKIGTPAENLVWYARHLLSGAFPWSLAMAPAFVAATRGAFGRSPAEPLGERLPLRAAWCALVVLLAFFVGVSKRFPWYVLPAYPILAALTGLWIADVARRAGAWSTAAAAAVLTLACWLVPADASPFDERAPVVAMETAWREPAVVAAAVGVPVTFALALAALAAARAVLRERAGRALAALLLLVLLPLAALRVGYPLRSMEPISELERLHAEVDAKRRAGEPIDFPVRLPPRQGFLKISYYFREHYVLRRGVIEGRRPEVYVAGLKAGAPGR
jgi:4-amino-4-deoxy-L-arabinose transferase-like glycosyltransferase